MADLGLLTGTAFDRYPTTLPSIPLVNMFAERAITEPRQFALISRLPLGETGLEYGSGPIFALFQSDGVLDGAIVAVSDSNLYVDGNNKGVIPNVGSGPISIAGNEMGIVITAGTDAKYYDGTTLRDIAFPDGAYVRKVLDQGGRFIFLRDGSQKYYWTQPLSNMIDGSGDIVIDSLDFASAENESDQLLDGLIFNDALVLAGPNSIEFHVPTGDDNAPWAPLSGRAFHCGVFATGFMTLWNNTFAWISSDGVMWQNGGSAPVMLSTAGVQQRILEIITMGLSDTALDSFFYEEHEFLRLRSGSSVGDLLRDANTGEFCTFVSDFGNMAGFKGGPSLSVNIGSLSGGANTVVFGSRDDGKLLCFTTFGADNLELANGTFTRKFRCGLPMDGGVVTIDNVLLRCQTGSGESGGFIPIAPGYDDPTVAMRTSRDGGRTFSDWDEIRLGAEDENRTKVEWRSKGMFDQPGFLAEFKVENSISFYVSGAKYNEPVAGRDRG